MYVKWVLEGGVRETASTHRTEYSVKFYLNNSLLLLLLWRWLLPFCTLLRRKFKLMDMQIPIFC